MARLENKIVFVTGATSGIGIDIARRCMEEGASRVYVAGRNAQRGEQVVTDLGERARFVSLDVASEDSWISAIDCVIDESGHLDVLVNNAGILTSRNVENTELSLFERLVMTNAGGVFLGCKHAIKVMKAKEAPSSIVNVLSTTALKTSAWTMAYGASKAAALSLNKSIALHLAEQQYPIRCNAVLPGVVKTPMLEDMLADSEDPEGTLAAIVASHPIGRLLEGEEIANAVIYFASDESSGVTGTHFSVDGGQTAV